MKANTKHTTNGLYAYLEASGVLEKGTDEAIAEARKNYWRIYKTAWRRQKRKDEKELTISWNTDELKTLHDEAKRHKISKTKFIKTATLAYIDKRYIVPNQLEIRKVAQLLALNYNSIQEMIDEKELPLQTGKIILEKIFELERAVLISLNSPKTIEQLITKVVAKNPDIKTKLFHLLETL